MIVAQELSKWFGSHLAVDALSFEIPEGQVVGFLGPNGAGKTTTIRMVTGFLPPSAGRVEVGGHEVRGRAMRVRRRLGYLPEAAPLYTEMRVREYLKFRCRLFGMARRKRKAAIDWVVNRCWLEEVKRRPIHQLSKGYRQRVGLAAALLHRPPVLILDEPTVGLDPSQIREVRLLIRELAGKHTILLSTHILPEVEQVCDRILMIASGRIRAQGTIAELQQTAAEEPRYVIETNARGAQNAVAALHGVRDVESKRIDEDWRRLTVTAARGSHDLREGLAQAIFDKGGKVRELRRASPSLERLFVRIAAEAEADTPQARSG